MATEVRDPTHSSRLTAHRPRQRGVVCGAPLSFLTVRNVSNRLASDFSTYGSHGCLRMHSHAPIMSNPALSVSVALIQYVYSGFRCDRTSSERKQAAIGPEDTPHRLYALRTSHYTAK
jgi:hypothetical protein